MPSSTTKIILPARKQNNRRDRKEIRSLILVREWPKAALINPKRKGRMRRIKRDADRAESNDSSDEKPQLKTGRPKLEFLRAYEIELAHSGDQTDETTCRNPRLRRESGRERDRKIVDHRLPPRR